MIFLMETDNYPGNDTIQTTLQLIKEIKAANDYDALIVAESELEFILLDKNEWISHQNLKK